MRTMPDAFYSFGMGLWHFLKYIHIQKIFLSLQKSFLYIIKQLPEILKSLMLFCKKYRSYTKLSIAVVIKSAVCHVDASKVFSAFLSE